MKLPQFVRWAAGIRWQWKVFIPIIAVLGLSFVALHSVLRSAEGHGVPSISFAAVMTIPKAVAELTSRRNLASAGGGKIRESGAGRKRVEEEDRQIRKELKRIVEQSTAGDPMSALRWTNKSTQSIAEELTRRGHPVSDKTVARCLREMDYTLQLNPPAPQPRCAISLPQPAGGTVSGQR